MIARGRLQVDGDLDDEKVVVYQGADGRVWVRPEYEFNDGRFDTTLTLREKLSGLEQRRMEIEMSDDRAYSNGRMAKINDEIAAVRKTLAAAPEASHE